MNLRTKIWVGSAIVLIIMVILMYLMPAYFVKKDISKAAHEIQTLFIQDHEALIQSQKIWLQNAIQKGEQNTNAILFMLAQRNNPTQSHFTFRKASPSTVWETLVHIASIDPDIGLIQAHSAEEDQAAVLTPFSAKLYTAANFQKQKSYASLVLKETKEPFLAIPIPGENQSDFTFYILVSPDDPNALKQFQKEYGALKEKVEERIKELGTFSFPISTVRTLEVSWAFKINLIRFLTPFFTSFKNPPAGVARLDKSGNGVAVLSKEVYSKTPLFDDAAYFKSHPPPYPTLPIAGGQAIIPDKNADMAYQGNTLLEETTYLTLGFPLGEFVRELALASNKTILMEVDKAYWIGFTGNGEKLPQEEFRSVSGISETGASLYIDAQASILIPLISLENGRLNFYEKHEGKGEKTILATLDSLENKLKRRISFQLAFIAFLSMLSVLIFLGRIGLSVIYPVTKLAAATQKVVKGQYADISLPEMGTREDEVAVLTRSFQDMVKGLEEREKIRGVLDKVVSKDVADEILKTQVHLGGEDRDVSILFSDVRDFTRITATLSPQETIQLLNECMTKISRVIEGEGGVIDKYVGDEVMAIFGAPTSTPDHALRAVSTGMLIVETLKKWNLDRVKQKKPAIEMGIGIHTGLVVAGNMGAEDRLNYTVLGANVNLAARLCDIAQKNQLIISQKTLEEPHVKESFHVKSLPPITIKGFQKPIQIYEVIRFKWEEG